MIAKLWGLIPTKYKLIGLAVIVVLNIAGYGYAYCRGVSDGKDAVENQAVNKAVSIQEKKDEIRNNRPDGAGVVVRLRNGTF